ncbi:MAG TPA: hypothetical protein VGV18_12500 [Verrucomicrobiae bacterium]|nr:hypothetical protein [Verrucomicrobiae bacterium]
MKRREHKPMSAVFRFWCLLFALLGLVAWQGHGADSLYENDAVVTDPVPIPDATNFLNTGYFTVTLPGAAPYQTHDTLNYTNTGYMDSFFGFDFDDFSTSTSVQGPAASFDNENTIEAQAQILVWATNIVDPGWMYVDNNLGLMQLAGNDVDLSRTTLLIQGGLGPGGANPTSLDYGVGVDTNAEWDPFVDLTATSALSSDFSTVRFPRPIFPFQTLFLPASTSYFKVDTIASNDVVYRAAFVEDYNPAISHNVYFGAGSVGNGTITVEWVGPYTNFATGEIFTNYLYLNDEPALISSNGVNIVRVINGIPDNFTILGSQTPLFTGPTPEGFQNVFVPGNITNNYSYLDAQMIATSVATNSLVDTNVSAIGGRIDILATNELNLSQAQITGENYMSVNSTNQFDGTGGAALAPPFSDMALGVTKGYFDVGNVLQAQIPIWSGEFQAWSTRWLVNVTNISVTVSNGIFSTNSFVVTNDYRVLLAASDTISPVSPSQVNNLTLIGTNSVVIRDTFNIFGSLFVNAQSLTLTTNGVGNGIDSLEGALNFENNSILWPTALPNLMWLTNDGAITIGNLAQFGAATPTYVTNTTSAIIGSPATNTLTETAGATNAPTGSSVTIGSYTYTFEIHLTNSALYQVQIAPKFDGTMSNLIAAINHYSGSWAKDYSTNTQSNTMVFASSLTNHAFLVTASSDGVAGNVIATTTTTTNLYWSGATLSGGTNDVAATTNVVSISGPYGAFLNNGSIFDLGSIIYAGYFENSGVFDNGEGNFNLYSTDAVLTNGELFAYFPFPPFFTNGFSGNISITANSVNISNVLIEAGGGLDLQVTNLLTDTGVTNGNIWFLDGGSSLNGLDLPIKPAAGDLLGTTINLLTPPPNKEVKNFWSAPDLGASNAGFSNNEAIGQLVLDVTTPSGAFYFSGPPGSAINNAIYVDRLVLENYASLADKEGSAGIPTLIFNTNNNAGNLTIYYADAISTATVNGGPFSDVSYLLNGLNGGHLVWVPTYTGYFSGTNVMYPSGAVVQLNAGLVSGGGNARLDSNGDGTPNGSDATPVFVGSQIDFQEVSVGSSNKLTWHSPPGSTNYIICSTNLLGWNVAAAVTNAPTVPPPSGWPITNVVYEPLTASNCWYRVKIIQNNSILYGE